ncbi:DUF2972 domain-containing protein [Campylobacter sp. LH-2024]|uniref:DUF2972 domain-containing protein n=1 Tax=Campylobacter sp. LH-2024 TaxID=3239825 RepID=UPI003AA96589
MHNPNSAVERIKNHLAYKLGQAMIEYNKNGWGYLSLFKKLYNIKKQHKKEKQIYQETIKVFPTLKYPELKQCPDYNEALKCYFHLSYMLGEALMKADQAKFKSSYIYLNQYIKEAKDSYYFFKEFNFSNKVLKVVDDNKQLFLKEFPKIKNLLNIHKDYQPIIDNIFHNFDYVIKKINLIEEWLLSNDFNEKYKKENHPYPSLLDPKKLNDEKEEINYKTIPAELAWEMNLPLPDNYEMMWLWVACSGTMAMYTFFSFIQIGSQAFGWEMEEKVYKDSYNYLIENNINVSIVPRMVMNNSKIYYLLQKKVSLLYICRDPISILRHAINHIGGKQNEKITFKMKEINLNSNLKEVFPEIHYEYSNSSKPSLKSLGRVIDNNELYFRSNRRINLLKKVAKDIICLDITSISGNEALKTFDFLSKQIFNIQDIQDYALFTKRINRHQGDLVVLPVKFHILVKNIDIKITVTTKNLIYFNSLEFIDKQNNFIDITSEIFQNRTLLFDNIILLINQQEYEILKNNQKLYQKSKIYLNDYMDALEKHEIEIKKHLISEDQILQFLKENKELRIRLKEIIDEDLTYVRENHPEYISKWKYYQEFEKICKELDS